MLPESTTKEIPLTRGLVATVDNADYARVNRYKWYAQKIGHNWYAAHNFWENGHGRPVYLHRFILGEPIGFLIDHIDQNGLNCTRANMRLASKATNGRNRGMNSRNKSGYKGVCWDAARMKWAAQIVVDRKRIHLGRFLDPVEAARAYDVAARMYHGNFSVTNFPE